MSKAGSDRHDRRDIPRAQDQLFQAGGGARAKYSALIVGTPGLGALLKHEARRARRAGGARRARARAAQDAAIRWLLGSCGRNVVFGQNVVLRHPHKIHIGDNVVIDDNCLLDAKGEAQRRHYASAAACSSAATRSSRARTATSTLADGANIGFNCEMFSASRVRDRARTRSLAAYAYLDRRRPRLRRPRQGRASSSGRRSAGHQRRRGRLDWRGRDGARRRDDRRSRRSSARAPSCATTCRPARRPSASRARLDRRAEPRAAERRWPSSLIVTSAPPLTEGGHLVLARALERALIEAGHRAGIVTTPSNRFGRQGAAYLANWLTDVGMTGDRRARRSGHHAAVSELRRAASRARLLARTTRCASTTTCGTSSRRGCRRRGASRKRVRRTLIRAADTYFFKHHVTRLFTISRRVRDGCASGTA